MVNPLNFMVNSLLRRCRVVHSDLILSEVTMSTLRFQSSTPDRWIQPRAYSDSSLRQMKYGRILPMEERRSFLGRILGR